MLVLHYRDLNRLLVGIGKTRLVPEMDFLVNNDQIQAVFGLGEKKSRSARLGHVLPRIQGYGQLLPSGNVRFLERTFWRALLKDPLRRMVFLDNLSAKRHLFPLKVDLLRGPVRLAEFDGPGSHIVIQKFYVVLNPWCFSTNLRIAVEVGDESLDLGKQVLSRLVSQVDSVKTRLDENGKSVQLNLPRLFDYVRNAINDNMTQERQPALSTRSADLRVTVCSLGGEFSSMNMSDAQRWLLEAHLVRQRPIGIKGAYDPDFAICDRTRQYLSISRHPIFHLNNWIGLQFLYESTLLASDAIVMQIETLDQPVEKEVARRVKVALDTIAAFKQTPWGHMIRAWDELGGRSEADYQKWMRCLTTYLAEIRERSVTMANYNINMRDGSITIGEGNRVITTINKGFMQENLKELGAAFALLRAEILQLDDVPIKVRNKAVRAIEDAEDEASDKQPNAESMVDSLRRVRGTLEAGGEVYDQAKGWVMRFKQLTELIAKVIPVAAPWISRILAHA